MSAVKEKSPFSIQPSLRNKRSKPKTSAIGAIMQTKITNAQVIPEPQPTTPKRLSGPTRPEVPIPAETERAEME